MTQEKKVDEGWKESAAMEKEQGLKTGRPDGGDSGGGDAPVFDFRAYITSLAMQALIFLGVMPHPLHEDRIEKNLEQARLLIDTLGILKEKTRGNLVKDEEDLLNTMLYELQMKFVEELKNEQSSSGKKDSGVSGEGA